MENQNLLKAEPTWKQNQQTIIGFISGYEDAIKHPGVFDASGAEVVERVYGASEGKKVILARCRCGCKRKELDRKATKAPGAQAFNICVRCFIVA
ncbi:hypothetical protein KWI10_21905 [Enterobacter asburiae]|nr:hypothetical protein [Enterobacter asburiae]